MAKNILAVVFALVEAFVIMIIFEFINSQLFPFPAGMDLNNLEAVQAFSKSLPWTAYILIWLGWVFGSLLSGFVVVRISEKRGAALPLLVGLILTVLGIVNFVMLTHPLWFVVIGLPMFLIMTQVGGKIASR